MSWIKSFGRLKGKNCNLKKIENLDDFLIKPEEFNFNDKDTVFEIGFGYGENLVEQAKMHPNKIFIGAEVYINGLISILKKIQDEEIKNILLWNKDARIFLEAISDNVLTKIFLLFPDPWPKKRHHKRRMINQKFLKLVQNKLKKSGEMIIATDHYEYSQFIEEEAKKIFELDRINSNSISTRYKDKSSTDIHTYKIYNHA
jgi:tRNA (guanine-N7-)-methyltransferase